MLEAESAKGFRGADLTSRDGLSALSSKRTLTSNRPSSSSDKDKEDMQIQIPKGYRAERETIYTEVGLCGGGRDRRSCRDLSSSYISF